MEGALYLGEEEEEGEGRNSKDAMINAEEEKMLKITEDRGWHILNGQMAEDYVGELTYVGKHGALVTDFVMTLEWRIG